MRIEIVVDDGVALPGDEYALRQAAHAAAADRGCNVGEIVIRVTSDASIQRLNRDHLGHDYPTDVISFAYRCDQPMIEGELAVSADTAGQRAAELGWPAEHELVLYVTHGVLHIAGMDDRDPLDRAEMRKAEQRVLIQLGIDDIVRFGVDATEPSLLEEQT